jgi:hypothetical protein
LSWEHITLTCVLSALASFAGVRWGRVSASSQIKKRMRDLEATTADLESSFESLLASHRVLRSRAGMRELRAREKETDRRETKAEVRARVFGNKSGPAFARAQLEQQ